MFVQKHRLFMLSTLAANQTVALRALQTVTTVQNITAALVITAAAADSSPEGQRQPATSKMHPDLLLYRLV